MKRFLRIFVMVSIVLILISLLFLIGPTTALSHNPKTYRVVKNGFLLMSVLVGFGSFLFHFRKLKSKHQFVGTETTLDDEFIKDELTQIRIPGILKFANGLFAIWAGLVAIVIIGNLSIAAGKPSFLFVLSSITAAFCVYTCLFIVAVGILNFFTPSKNPIPENSD